MATALERIEAGQVRELLFVGMVGTSAVLATTCCAKNRGAFKKVPGGIYPCAFDELVRRSPCGLPEVPRKIASAHTHERGE